MAALSGLTLEWSQCGDGSSSGKQLQHDIEMSGLGRSAVNSKVESYFHRPQGVNVQEPAGDLLGLYENEPTLENISPTHGEILKPLLHELSSENIFTRASSRQRKKASTDGPELGDAILAIRPRIARLGT